MTRVVRLVFAEQLSDEVVGRLMAAEPAVRVVWREEDPDRTEVTVDTASDSLVDALTTAIVVVAAATPTAADSAEVLSEAEHVRRLGGPAALKAAERQFNQHATGRL